jgi:hypothetical protein
MATTHEKALVKHDKRPQRDCECEAGCETAERNRFFFGKRMTPETYQREQRYAIERRRMINRAVLGWGVVHGLTIRVDGAKLRIGTGLALDAHGRELMLTEDTVVNVTDLLVLDPAAKVEAATWLLVALYAERSSDPVTVQDPCHCERDEWDSVCETVRFAIRRACAEDCCNGAACTLSGDCLDPNACDGAGGTGLRGSRALLCAAADKPVSTPADICWRELDERCGPVRVDIGSGVPLACVTVGQDECQRWVVEAIEPCGPRRLVKRNDILFDLIRGCDLTRIIDVSWCDWHRNDGPVDFATFSDKFGFLHGDEQSVTTDFSVRFSRRIRAETVRPDCFAMTIMNGEREGGWWQALRVPITGVALSDGATKATLVVDAGWLRDAVRSLKNLFRGGETYVEIEVRCDFILDCNGQAVDGNAIGRHATPSGNGSPGGAFCSTFRVNPDTRTKSDVSRS